MLGPPRRGIYHQMLGPRSDPASGTIRSSKPSAMARSYRNSHACRSGFHVPLACFTCWRTASSANATRTGTSRSPGGAGRGPVAFGDQLTLGEGVPRSARYALVRGLVIGEIDMILGQLATERAPPGSPGAAAESPRRSSGASAAGVEAQGRSARARRPARRASGQVQAGRGSVAAQCAAPLPPPARVPWNAREETRCGGPPSRDRGLPSMPRREARAARRTLRGLGRSAACSSPPRSSCSTLGGQDSAGSLARRLRYYSQPWGAMKAGLDTLTHNDPNSAASPPSRPLIK